MIMAAQNELTELLQLRSCQFEAFPFSPPAAAAGAQRRGRR